MGWILAMRLHISVLAGLLAVASQKICKQEVDVRIAIFVATAATATMVHNDWRDRFHDLHKGKGFAFLHGSSFLFFAVILWVLAVGQAIFLWETKTFFGILSIAIMTLGMIYSETRKLPAVPGFIVAIASASPSLYSLSESYVILPIAIFSFVTAIGFCREIICDIKDKDYDIYYKWTIPSVFGERRSRLFTGMVISLSAVAAFISAEFLYPINKCGLLLLLASALTLVTNGNRLAAKILIDLSAVIILTAALL